MGKAGDYGCFFCGASVKIGKNSKGKDGVTYTCTGCGKKVTVKVDKGKKAAKAEG
jgi:DNA-directed RNA polymerase subunit RPC12/RpoP